jgi:hypothetical protein
MEVDRRTQIRGQLAAIQLALQLLVRRRRPWGQQRRIARIGLASARKLAVLMVGGLGYHRAGRAKA